MIKNSEITFFSQIKGKKLLARKNKAEKKKGR